MTNPHQLPAGTVQITSAYGFAPTVERLQQAIAQAGFLVIHVINTQQILASQGIEIAGLIQILYFHPRYMQRLLAASPAAVIEAPLKLLVREGADGSVQVVHHQPTALFGRYPGVEAVGVELEAVVGALIQTLRT
jgi:uncharacterized protein (DUF302 family)